MFPLTSYLDNSRKSLYYIIVILVFSLLAIMHFGPLNGTLTGLILTISTFLYLPGWLLLRFLGLTSHPNWIVRLAWTLLAGLGLTITVGGVFRFLQVPIPVYVATLITLMILFTVLRVPFKKGLVSQSITTEPPPERIMLYGLLTLCCVIALYIGLAVSQYRINMWEDQTVFASLIDWLVHSPDKPGLLSRQISSRILDERWITDGWTYNHAVWVWSSNVSAADLIWYRITPLFSWAIPLVIFALIYELSQSLRTAVYSAAGLTIAAMLTLDSLTYIRTVVAYGQNVFSYLNTLRQFSTAIMLPLVQMASFSYLRGSRQNKLVIIWLGAVALAFLHPRQIVILCMTVSAFCGLYWLTHRSRERLVHITILLILVFSTLFVPFVQRRLLERQDPRAADVLNSASVLDTVPDTSLPPNITRLGNSLVLTPSSVFYSPIMFVSVITALLLLWPMCMTKRLELMFVCGATAITLLLLFTPVVAELFFRVVSIRLAPTFIIAIPIGPILGIAFDYLISYLRRFAWVGPLLAGVLIVLLIIDPSPLPASGSDQLRAFNQAQSFRNILTADQYLLDMFAQNPALELFEPTVILTPSRIANYIVESVPYALVTNGRTIGAEEASASADRFFNQGDYITPFLDTADIQYLEEWQIRFIITESSHIRTAQLLLQPNRFALVAQNSGYFVFRVLHTTATQSDEVFARMNTLFPSQRFDTQNGFRLDQPVLGDWQAVIEEWTDLRATQETFISDYGLAFSLIMVGREAEALMLWQELYDKNPQNDWIVTALVHTLLRLNQADKAKIVLHEALTSADTGLQAFVANQFLRPSVLYKLDNSLVQDMVNVAVSAPAAWNLVAVYDQFDAIRMRSALLISRGFYAAADAELRALPLIEIRPEDLWTRAMIHVAASDVSRVWSLLEAYGRDDYFAAARVLHPDRWITNGALGLLDILRGDTAVQSGNLQAAEYYYKQAISNGMDIAGRIFLAEVQTQAGNPDAAAQTLAELDTLPGDASLWSAMARVQLNPSDSKALTQLNNQLAARSYPSVSIETSPRFHHLYDMPSNLSLHLLDSKLDDTGTVRIRALLGVGSYVGCPVGEWNVVLFDPIDYTRYGEADQPTIGVPGVLIEWTMIMAVTTQPLPTSIGVKASATCNALVEYLPEYTSIQP